MRIEPELLVAFLMRGEDTDLNQLESVYDDLGNAFTYLFKLQEDSLSQGLLPSARNHF